MAMPDISGPERLLARLSAVLGALAGAALAGLVLLVTASVVARYGLNRSFVWGQELAQWLYVGVIFLGMPVVVSSRSPMRIDLASRHLPQALGAALADAVVAYVVVALGLGGSEVISALGGTSPTLGAPEWLRFALVPVAAALSLLALLLRALARGGGWLAALGPLLLGGLAYAGLNLSGLGLAVPLPPSAVAGLGFALTLAAGVPVAFALLFGVLVAGPFGSLLPPAAAVQTLVGGSSRFLLLAIPFFLLTGLLMQAGGLAARLIDLAQALVGRLRGGLAQTTLVFNLLFSGLSGSSIADAALGAKLLVPSLVRHGYRPPYACAVVAATSVLDNIIPPSIAFLILASVTNLSVGDLWLGGLTAGLVLGLALGVVIAWIGGGRAPERRAFSAGVLLRAAPVLGLAALILVTLRFGVVTPTEAGVIALLYALILGLAYRAYGARGLGRLFREAAVETAGIGLLIGAAAPFGFLLSVDQVPSAVTGWVLSFADGPLEVMLLANLLLLVLGLVLDIGVAILLLAPLLLPIATAAGIDPVHFGVVLVVNLMIHGLTPPIGVLVLVTSALTGVPAGAVFRAVLPLLGALLVGLALIAAVPQISLALVAR